MVDSSTDGQIKQGPLQGVKVVEYGVFHAGPGAGAILGDLGADVIKIESGDGDPERFWRNVAGIDLTLKNGNGILFEISNRNKKGICLDIENDKGRDIFNKLVKETDVFLTNLRKSTKAKMGITFDDLKKINPKLVHINVSGYGPEGPMSDVGAFDSMGQAYSGMMFTTGTDEPTLIRLGVLDQATAITASHAVLAALFDRERRGIGQEVHVSLYSSALWLQHMNYMFGSVLGIDPCMKLTRTMNSPLRNHFKCRDGKYIICTHHPERKYWPAFCKVMGRPDIVDDSRYTDEKGRPINFEKTIPIFDKIFEQKTRDEWMNILLDNGLMFSPVKSIMETATDPQAIENGYVVSFEDEILGKMSIPGYPAHFSEGRAGIKSVAPGLGEHTDEILKNLGYSEDDISELKASETVK